MTRVLIIEDEAKTARELATLISQVDDRMQVQSIVDSVEDAITQLTLHPQPDLIFSDIQLADGSCFDIFQKIEVKSPVIFCTAFDEYLLDAFETNAVSYLLKPISRNKLEKAITKFRSLKAAFGASSGTTDLAALMSNWKFRFKTALLVHQKEKIIPIQVHDIAYVYLDKTLLFITTHNNQRYHLTSTLEELESMLDPSQFFRANRQFLINRAAVANAERFFARKLVARLKLETPEAVVISKARATEFLHWLQGS
jgi:two-component system LytT family response regulator